LEELQRGKQQRGGGDLGSVNGRFKERMIQEKKAVFYREGKGIGKNTGKKTDLSRNNVGIPRNTSQLRDFLSKTSKPLNNQEKVTKDYTGKKKTKLGRWSTE